MLTQEYVDLILQTYPETDIPEIIDPDDPDYEDPESEYTNQSLLDKQPDIFTPHCCQMCTKKVYNKHVFAKHVYWHTNNNNVTEEANADAVPNRPLKVFK